MGTDIHMYAEVREPGGPWRKVGKVFQSSMYDKTDNYFSAERFLHTDQPYDGRNYNLFAILASVRNGSGFAGVTTSGGFNPISEPRGLPDDLSDELKAEPDLDDESDDPQVWLGDHSFSWLTLREMLDFDWSQQVRLCGVISWEQYREYRKGTRPENGWCGAISGGGNYTIEQAEAELLTEPPPPKCNVRVWWKETYRESVGPCWFEAMDSLAKLGEAENVRIVFGFDS